VKATDPRQGKTNKNKGSLGSCFYFKNHMHIIHISLIPESNATILAQNVKNVKLDSYEKI